MQEGDEAEENLPAAQMPHEEDAGAFENLPSTQAVHSVKPISLKEPARQFTQLLLPSTGLCLPAEHSVQSADAPRLNLPVTQTLQLPLSSSPW